MFKTFVILTGA